MSADLRLGVGLLLLIVIGLAVLTIAQIPHRRALLIASVRAIVQLTIVALALRGVFAAPWAVVAVVTVMFSVATWTAGRRLREHAHAYALGRAGLLRRRQRGHRDHRRACPPWTARSAIWLRCRES